MGFFPCRAARKPEADSAQESGHDLIAAAYKDDTHDLTRCRGWWDIGPFLVLYSLYVTCLERAKELLSGTDIQQSSEPKARKQML